MWKVKKSNIHATGIFATKNIKKNTKIIEYIGEKIPRHEGDKRSERRLKKYMNSLKTGSVYIFQLNRQFDIDGSPLYNAVLKENPKMVRYLISKKADINSEGNGLEEETPAYAAVKLNNLQILKILVKAGANLNTQTPDGGLAYDLAVSYKNQEMIDYLKEHGARTEVNDEEVRPDYEPDSDPY